MGKDPLADCVGFEWDEWNSGKNWEKHRVTPEETEEVFFHDPSFYEVMYLTLREKSATPF